MKCKCGYQNSEGAVFCAGCGRKLNGKKSSKLQWFLMIVLVFLVVALCAVLVRGEKELSEPVSTEHVVSSNTLPESRRVHSWRDNVLMRDRVDSVAPLGYFRSEIVADSVFGSDYLQRTDICRVVFEDTVQNVPDDCWDVSDAQDNSVLAWVISAEDNMYELHIAAEGGINGKLACEDLFCGYQNVTSIDFNNCFHTEEAEDFSRMFYYCWQLEDLNLDGIRTDNATNLSEMFANCFYLTAIDVSSFDTSNVENTSGMFSNCRDLQYVDIMGFDLFNVRDVSYMFYQCPAGDGLQLILDGFWFRNVDRYENFMDEGVLVNGEPWITLFEVGDIPEKKDDTTVVVGDIVVFGSYEQDNLRSNGSEAVQWLVLDVQGDSALLLSRYALDSQPYHNASVSVNWETCSLREWLNSEFLNTAFTDAEQELILLTEVDNGKTQGNSKWVTNGGNNTYDYIFLLSYAESELLFGDQRSRICSPTSYAVNMGADIRALDSTNADAGWWWLRSPGEKSNHASFVNFDGSRYTNVVSNGYLSVRPAVWVDVSGAVLGN